MSDSMLEEKKIESHGNSAQYKEYNSFADKFAEFTHAYIHDNISRADQKSTIIFSFILFTFLLLFNPTNKWLGGTLLELLKGGFHFGQVFIYIMILLFACSIILAFSTVFPRLKVRSYPPNNDLSNLLYWESILKNKTPDIYTANIKNKTPDDLVKIKLEHCYEISLVCKKKHNTLRFSMAAAMGGIILFLIVQFLIALRPTLFI